MPRRNLKDRNIRKIFKSSRSYVITLPIEVVKNLGWRAVCPPQAEEAKDYHKTKR